MKLKDSIEIKRKEITKWPKVAIIILNWNGWKDTIECLESVFRNNYPNYKVIVVDNSSTDGSIEKIKDWADGRQEVLTPDPTHSLYHLSHPPVLKPIPYIEYNRKKAETGGNPKLESSLVHSFFIKYPLILIQSNDNLGFSAGNNIGIRYVLEKGDCDYICLLNNDTVVTTDFLNKLLKTAETNLNIGIVGGKIFYYNKSDKIWYAAGKLDLFRGSGYHRYYEKNSVIKTTFITGCLMLINIEVFRRVGFLPEEYFLYVEDVDFCYFSLEKGFELFVNLDSKIYHKVYSSPGNSFQIISSDTVYYSTRNRLYFMLKKQKSKTKIIRFLVFFSITRLCKILQWLVGRKKEYIIAAINGIEDFFKGKYGRR